MRAIPFAATGRDWRICVWPRYDGLFCGSQWLKSQFAELSGPFVEKSSWKRTVVVIASPCVTLTISTSGNTRLSYWVRRVRHVRRQKSEVYDFQLSPVPLTCRGRDALAPCRS